MLEAGVTIEKALAWARTILTENQISDDGVHDSAAIDSKVLLCAALGCEQVYLHTWPDKVPNKTQIQTFQQMIEKRILGYPVAYIIGFKDFWSLRLAVSEATLIPRPETELLVELALNLALPNTSQVLDLGTGTGAIALALASEQSKWSVTGLDKSHDAVNLAKKNGKDNGLPEVEFIQSNWFSSLSSEKKFELIVTNPPYIETDDYHLKMGDVRFEPASALTSGEDGLDDIRFIIHESVNFLVKGGWLLIEHGNRQGDRIADLLVSKGFSNVKIEYDLNEHARVTMGQFI
ncbi:peptide chain release factor N(5)-glutamine methyltransferase [Paraglaciecola sp. 2405UD69-4]|uniref:peptide chain release factor N(5)-glutamine methyltransferase n=1 Tax=Paraglaciecola sp. 2405UD69-4 TaxID=3391836 RepID=UPI0039C977FA